MLATIGLVPAHAEVFVLGNTQTGHVVIRGNAPDAADQAGQKALAIRDTGWVQLFGDDAPGWGAVSCVVQGGRYHFFIATGHKTNVQAASLAKAAADRFIAANGGDLVFMCAPRWENRGQPLAFGGNGFGPPVAKPPPEPGLIDRAKALIRRQVATPDKDYKRDCLPPAPSARAEIKPIAPGVMPAKDRRPPAEAWRPARWCPPAFRATAAGKRG